MAPTNTKSTAGRKVAPEADLSLSTTADTMQRNEMVLVAARNYKPPPSVDGGEEAVGVVLLHCAEGLSRRCGCGTRGNKI